MGIQGARLLGQDRVPHIHPPVQEAFRIVVLPAGSTVAALMPHVCALPDVATAVRNGIVLPRARLH
jgi:hypothetical protein